jgi:predicted dehydrogenase
MTTDVTQLPPALGVALIGGGFMGTVHARAARSAGASLIGVAASSQSGAARARAATGAAIAFGSVDELIADERVDVVHICSPNNTHAEYARAALAAGKHVICEKPLATSVDDAEELATFARSAGMVASVPFVYRFHPMVREARARVRHGQTGRLFSIRGSYLQDWLATAEDDDWRVDPRNGGPSRAFADIGSHLCDLIEFVADDRIARLVSRTRTVHPDRAVSKAITTEDLVTMMFETENGSVGTLNVSQVSAGHKNRLAIEIDAEHESLAFDQETPDVLRVGTTAGFLATPRSESISPEAARYSLVPAGHPQGYQDAFNAFIADTYSAVRDGIAPDGLPTFADGYRAALITEAVLRSNDSGEWVDVAERPALTIAS